MFDFHMHSDVSYDGRATAEEMAVAAQKAGLREICFTDHLDYDPGNPNNSMDFNTEAYCQAYDDLSVAGLVIRRGCEFGMLKDNRQTLTRDLQRRHFDFVIGSVHFIDGLDPYFPEFWETRTVDYAERRYLETILECLQNHDDFDVLGHLTYISKTRYNPVKRPMEYERYRDLTDEILRTLARKGKGMEINTSGRDACGVFLPDVVYLRRFRELGGSIVTVGSDAHDPSRAGQYCGEAIRIAADLFGHVCTFADREPVFHRL